MRCVWLYANSINLLLRENSGFKYRIAAFATDYIGWQRAGIGDGPQ